MRRNNARLMLALVLLAALWLAACTREVVVEVTAVPSPALPQASDPPTAAPTDVAVTDVVPTDAAPTDAAPTDVAATDVPPTAVAESLPPAEPPAEEAAADADVIPVADAAPISGFRFDRLARATVHVALLDDDLNLMGYGSGTIVAADGLILTNAHVAQPSAIGARGMDPAYIGIELLEQEDEPPVPTFFASVVAVDGTLDLAVLRIDSYLDGSPIRPNELNLPTVPLGNSDEVHLGDDVLIFGYPGIGGDTITFTRGSVSGFSSQEGVGSRAWIKTDATIAGGNSGGLAVNDAGQIIGVPTQASAGNGIDVTDCRVVQDTNGDGRLDSRDNCIPIGGFINALRPINLARPLIQAAQSNLAYVSPYGGSGAARVVAGRGELVFDTWARDFDRNGCAVDPLASYPTGVNRVVAVFDWRNMVDGASVRYTWRLDGDVVVDNTVAWQDGSSGECFPFWLENNGKAMPDGRYDLAVAVDGAGSGMASAETVVGSTAAVADAYIEGRIVSASTGRPIAEAIIVVLKPGVLVDPWLNDPDFDAIYTSAESDGNGYYELPDPLERGVRYEAAVVADGFNSETGWIEIDPDDPEVVYIEVALAR